MSIGRTSRGRCARSASAGSSPSSRPGRPTPVAGWLRSLARELHAELGGPGVGALGMCFTGGFALAMMVDPAVAAPVLAQPSHAVRDRAGSAAPTSTSPPPTWPPSRSGPPAGCEVLGLRYRKDPAVGTRFDTLTRELGGSFIRVEFDGQRPLDAHRAPPAGGRRPGARLLRREAPGLTRWRPQTGARRPEHVRVRRAPGRVQRLPGRAEQRRRLRDPSRELRSWSPSASARWARASATAACQALPAQRGRPDSWAMSR